MARGPLDYEDRNEVTCINNNAVAIGYLSMSIKGVGFLVLTWTTVVLLGGFVSVLNSKDFWCLAFITLVQTAGIFDVVLNEKLSYMPDAVAGIMVTVLLAVWGDSDTAEVTRILLACILMLVQLVLLVAVLCPLAIIYVFGILMSGGISLWRLIEHDYVIGGNSKSKTNLDGESSNLVPALDALYYLSVLQAVLFCYRLILGYSGVILVRSVATKDNYSGLEVVSKYLLETRNGCEKDPSFVKGRNLITHAIDLIGSNSPLDCISGVKALYNAICIVEKELHKREKRSNRSYKGWSRKYHRQLNIVTGQRLLMKHLVVHASSSPHILKKLLEMLDSRGLHDRQTRNQAAMVVERLACNINLEQFPRGIQHISSLIGTFQEYSISEPYKLDYLYDEQIWDLNTRCLTPSPASSGEDSRGELEKDYKELLLLGLSILRKLAADENNCRVMSDTRDLVSKIMAPLSFNLLHLTTEDHCAWSDILEKSMEVISQLAGAPGEIGAKLRHEISNCEEAINTLQGILDCSVCKEGLQQRSIQILTRLYMYTQSNRSTNFVVLKNKSSEDFLRMLVGIFTNDNKYSSSIREYTGGALSDICFRGGLSDATFDIQTCGDDVVDSLTKVLGRDKNKVCRQKAAEILEHLCAHCTIEDECLGKLKKVLTDAIQEVLAEILHGGDETQKRKETYMEMFPIPPDIESQYDTELDRRISSSSPSHLQMDEHDGDQKESIRSMELLSSLLSLCGTVYNTTFTGDLAPQLDASSFLNKLNEVVVKKSDHHMVENLLMCKATGKMVISMMKHSGGMFIKQEELESLIKALSNASKDMLNLDHSMIFSCDSSLFATTLPKLNKRTLASIMKEAKELLDMVPSTSISG